MRKQIRFTCLVKGISTSIYGFLNLRKTMKTYPHFIGIDISKLTIDVAILKKGKSLKKKYKSSVFNNDIAGFKKMQIWLKKEEVTFCNSFLCMEHTGSYSLYLCLWLEEKKWDYCLCSPLHLKRTLGLTRGKNDKVDAERICHFAYLYREELTPTKLPKETLLKLKAIFSFREQSVRTSTRLKHQLKEAKHLNKVLDNNFIVKKIEKSLALITKEIKEIEVQMDLILEEDSVIKKNFKLLKTVVGIGRITALAMLITTQNFTAFDNARQFNCYAGVAPFENSSGTSLKGKTKTSPLSNKKVKALLGNGVCSAIQHDKEFKNYYEKKIKEGKHEQSVKNALKSKIISRAFAVIKRQTPFVKFKQPMAA